VTSMSAMTRTRCGIAVAGFGFVLLATLVVATPAFAADTTKPTAPSNVRVTATSETTISLAWNAATDKVRVDPYRAYEARNSIAPTSALTYVATNLWPHSTHTFYLTAYDAAGNASPLSNMITSYTKPDTTGPGAPPSLTAQFDGSAVSVALQWKAAI